jgi:hypothetical protein
LPVRESFGGDLEGGFVILISLTRDDSRTIVSVAGRLDEEHLAKLREQCSAVETNLVFDLSELKSADIAAIHWLGGRHGRGDEILGASPYIKLLLEREQRRSDQLTTTGSRGASEDGE